MRPTLTHVALAAVVSFSPLIGCGAGPVDEGEPQAEIAAGLSTELQRGAPLSVLVFLREQADLTSARTQGAWAVVESLRSTARETQGSLTDWLDAQAIGYQTFYVVNLVVIDDATPDLVRRLQKRRDVARLAWNRPVRLSLPPQPQPGVDVDGPEAIGASVTSTGADRVWTDYKARGQGIVVAGADTGVSWTHTGIKRQYRGWDGKNAVHDYSWHDAIRTKIVGSSTCGYNVSAPCDDNSHGTHTVGSMVGDDGAGNQVGMAPDAKWIACRNMDAGTGRPSSYIECFEWFLAPYPQGRDPKMHGDPMMAPHVINNSWGCDASESCSGDEILPVLKSLAAAGVMVVVSAGNSGPSCSTIDSQPATHSEETLSVGAHDHRNLTIASFSSRGPSVWDKLLGPDVSAPGVGIRSTTPGDQYASMSGTSMAGPHVAGMVAVLWSADASLKRNIAETVNVVRASADRKTSTQNCGGVLGSAVPNNTYGYGLINAYNAVSSRIRPPPPAK